MAPLTREPADGTIGRRPGERRRRAGDLASGYEKGSGGIFPSRREWPDVIEPLLPVLLDASGAQAGETVLVDGVLPGQEFFDGEGVATAGFLKRKQAAADGSNDLGLAPDDPALRARCRQIGDRQRAAVRPDNVFCPWSEGLRHGSTHALDFGNAREMYRPRLKICLNGTLQLDHCRRNAAARPAEPCLKSLELVDSRAFG